MAEGMCGRPTCCANQLKTVTVPTHCSKRTALTSALARSAEALSTQAVSRVERAGRRRESSSARPVPVASAAHGGRVREQRGHQGLSSVALSVGHVLQSCTMGELAGGQRRSMMQAGLLADRATDNRAAHPAFPAQLACLHGLILNRQALQLLQQFFIQLGRRFRELCRRC